MMLYKNTKVKVRSPDGDTDLIDMVADVHLLFILYINIILYIKLIQCPG